MTDLHPIEERPPMERCEICKRYPYGFGREACNCNSPSPAVPRMDEETERRIRELKSKLRDWAVIWEKGEVSADPSLDAVLDAEDALRLRISQLISEAEERGYADALRMGYDAAEAYAKGADTR